MSDRFDIARHEAEVVRIFRIDLADDAEREAFLQQDRSWGPVTALNVKAGGMAFSGLVRSNMDVIDPEELGEMGLSGLLYEGYGIPEHDLAPLRAQLDAIRDHVLIVGSRAFAGKDVTVEPRAPLRWVATLSQEPSRGGTMEQLHVASAQGQASGNTSAEPVKPVLPMFLKITLLLMALAAIAAILLGVSGAGK
jgi:hypothetical protein